MDITSAPYIQLFKIAGKYHINKNIFSTASRIRDSRVIFEKIRNQTFANTKLGILVRLFTRYLQLREANSTFIIEAVATVLGWVISFTFESDEDFRPEFLWEFLKINSENDYRVMLHVALYEYMDCKDLEKDISDRYEVNLIKMCYFGEFVFQCATLHEDPDSIVNQILYETTDEEELEMIDLMWKSITKELGILIYIAFKNWTSHFDIRYRDDLADFRWHSLMGDGSSVSQELSTNDELKSFFDKFVQFTKFEISGCYKSAILKNNDDEPTRIALYLMQDIKNLELEVVKDLKVDIVWDLTKKCAGDVFYYLYFQHDHLHEPFSFDSFKNLPLLIQYYKNRFDENFRIMLFTLSKLLDFYFLHNWENEGFVSKYINLCKELKTEVNHFLTENGQFLLKDDFCALTKFKFCDNLCLLPFFNMFTRKSEDSEPVLGTL